MCHKYDVQGNLIEQSCYGIDGELCENNFGQAKIVYKYMPWNELIEVIYYNKKGEIVNKQSSNFIQ